MDAHGLGTAIVHEQPCTQAHPLPRSPAIYHSRLHLVECTAILFSSDVGDVVTTLSTSHVFDYSDQCIPRHVSYEEEEDTCVI